ncbi:MAG TPA: RNA polymerase sigma-70 factor [Gemmatimonadaceae bacterium]|nr:RNA polymerase sigma-70 factor [Gemmatimonadaceae bacterium]
MTRSDVAGDVRPNDVMRYRPKLLGLAYRMLGDMDDAEDAVQEAFLRWHESDRADIRSAEAWLVTVVTRISVDRLRRAATERASYIGPWLPEPIATEPPSTYPAPDREAELASDLSVALLVLLERLAPEERAAFLLREVFGTPYEEIARILDRRQDAVRQMVHRARTRVHEQRPRVPTPPDLHEKLLERFLAAVAADDAPALLELLAPEVVLVTDGGGVVRAARRVMTGVDAVARTLLALARKFGARYTRRLTWLNGQPAIVQHVEDRIDSVIMIAPGDDGIGAVYVIRNPEKLRRVLATESAVE